MLALQIRFSREGSIHLFVLRLRVSVQMVNFTKRFFFFLASVTVWFSFYMRNTKSVGLQTLSRVCMLPATLRMCDFSQTVFCTFVAMCPKELVCSLVLVWFYVSHAVLQLGCPYKNNLELSFSSGSRKKSKWKSLKFWVTFLGELLVWWARRGGLLTTPSMSLRISVVLNLCWVHYDDF